MYYAAVLSVNFELLPSLVLLDKNVYMNINYSHQFCVCVCFVMPYFVSILVFAIILKRKRKLVALLLLSYRFNVTNNVLWLFLTVPWLVYSM